MKPISKKYYVPGAIFALSLCLSVAVLFFTSHIVLNERALQFQNETDRITSFIEARMNLYIDVLHGAQGLYAASNAVESNQWADYVASLDLPDNYAGISGMSYYEMVSQKSLASYPYTIFPEAQKPYYYPLTYAVTVVPSVSTSTILGFDASSDPVRFEAMQKAADTDSPTASGVVLSITTHLPTFSVYEPVYRSDAFASSSQEREDALVGFVAAGFRVQRLFDGLTSDPVFDKNIGLQIYDAPSLSQSGAGILLYDTASSTPVNPNQYTLTRQTQVKVAGRVWTLSFTSLATYTANPLDSIAPIAASLGVAFLGLMLAYLVYFYAAAKEKAEVLAGRIKKELRESEEKYRAIFDSLQDVLYRTDNKGRITLVSPSVERFMDIPAAKVIGMSADQFSADSNKWNEMTKLLREKGTVSDYPLELRAKGGIVKVSLNARAMLDDDGKFSGIEGIFRDVTERSQAEDELKRLNALMINRELKMVELKQELNKKSDQQNHDKN